MSSLPVMGALPDRAVDRLFARFAAMYGDASMKRMWGAQSADAVKAIWGEALGRFDLQAIMGGLRNLEAAGSTYPPTLPEFVAACRRKPETIPPEHRPALPPPPRTAEQLQAGRERMDAALAEIGRPPKRDPAAWAYRVIERYRSGDQVVAHASYKIAIEALKNLGREVPA